MKRHVLVLSVVLLTVILALAACSPQNTPKD